jgi:site-specific recombinase XerD
VGEDKRALLEAGKSRGTVARRFSVIRGSYREFAANGLIAWEVAQDIAAIRAPEVQRNSTPALTSKEAVALLQAIPEGTLQGVRDFALMTVFFVTGCRVSAIVSACVGHLETDGVDHYYAPGSRSKNRPSVESYMETSGWERRASMSPTTGRILCFLKPFLRH